MELRHIASVDLSLVPFWDQDKVGTMIFLNTHKAL